MSEQYIAVTASEIMIVGGVIIDDIGVKACYLSVNGMPMCRLVGAETKDVDDKGRRIYICKDGEFVVKFSNNMFAILEPPTFEKQYEADGDDGHEDEEECPF